MLIVIVGGCTRRRRAAFSPRARGLSLHPVVRLELLVTSSVVGASVTTTRPYRTPRLSRRRLDHDMGETGNNMADSCAGFAQKGKALNEQDVEQMLDYIREYG